MIAIAVKEVTVLEWNVGIRQFGLHYDGFIAQNELDIFLELQEQATPRIETKNRLRKKACDVKDYRIK